jgi:nucleoside-diphosphate-sugar epimerase
MEDPTFAQKVFSQQGPDLVYHLASHVSGSRDIELVAPTVRANFLSTLNVLAAATSAGCFRVVLAGSLEEPGEPDPYPVPTSPYAAAKWASSGYARMFAELYGTPVSIARLFMVYGPGQVDSRKLIPYVIRSLLEGNTPALSSGSRPVDWVFVDDVVEALIDLGSRSAALGEVDIGSGELVTVRAVVEELERILSKEGQSRFGAIPDRPMERVRVADISRTADLIGWRPRTSLRQGLLETVDWVRENLDELVPE